MPSIMFDVEEQRMVFLFLFFYLSVFSRRHSSVSASIDIDEGPPAFQFHDAHLGSVQLNNVVEALIGSGDRFDGWANVLQGADPFVLLPLTATLFVPSNDALSVFSFADDQIPALLMYHVVPFQLAFEDLLELETGSRLPTVLPNHTIQLTNNGRLNFTLGCCSTITHPDLYYNGAISVHAISSLLNYSTIHTGGTADPNSTPTPDDQIDDQDGKEIQDSTDPPASWDPAHDRNCHAVHCSNAARQFPLVDSLLFAVATATLPRLWTRSMW